MNIQPGSFRQGFHLALLGAGLFFGACGGGGGGAAAPASISGTVAIGAPLLDAEVTIKDRDGTTVTTRTSATDGRYVLSVQGLEAPYFVRVDDGTVDGLYSVGWQPGVVNVTPLTSMTVHVYYQAHQLDMTKVWNKYSSGMPVPTRAAMLSIGDQMERALTPYLLAYGVTADNFDVVTTPFAADGSGFDAVLGMSQAHFGGTTAVIDIDDSAGATSSYCELDFAVETDTGRITASSDVITASGWERRAIDLITLPLGAGEGQVDAALSGVETTLRSMVAVMNGRGAALTGADLLPFFSPHYLNDGLDAAAETTHLATGIEGTITFLGAMRVVSYNPVTEQIAVKFAVKLTAGGMSDVAEVPDLNDDGYVFARASDGSWKFYGNQRLALVMAKGMVLNFYSTATSLFPDPFVDLQLLLEARAPAGQIQDATAFGDIPPDGPQTVALSFSNSDELGEHYAFQRTWLPVQPSAGTNYVFSLWMTGGVVPVEYQIALPSAPEVGLRLAGYDDMPYADCLADPDYRTIGFVHPGTPLKVQWEAPTTLAAGKVSLYANVFAPLATEEVDADAPISRTATSGMITIPTTVAGKDVTGVEIVVVATGKNGEEIQLRDFIGQTP